MSGVQKLGSLFRSEMHKVSKYNIGFSNIVLGRVTSGRGLKIDGLDYTIPSGDYSVCRSCADGLIYGKRVLVAFFNDEPIIVDIVGNDELGIAQSHTHDDRYYTRESIDSMLEGSSVAGHTHDDRYYTETEVNNLLSGKSDKSHAHDDRYYTEAETNALISKAKEDTLDSAQKLVNDLETQTNTKLAGYAKTEDIPTVPTNVSAFNNDAGYLTEHQSLEGYAKTEDIPAVPTKVSAFENDKGYLTEHQSLDGYAKTDDIPTVPEKVSAFSNDAGYITAAAIPDNVSAFNNDAGYLTEHQSLAGYAKTEDFPIFRCYQIVL